MVRVLCNYARDQWIFLFGQTWYRMLAHVAIWLCLPSLPDQWWDNPDWGDCGPNIDCAPFLDTVGLSRCSVPYSTSNIISTDNYLTDFIKQLTRKAKTKNNGIQTGRNLKRHNCIIGGEGMSDLMWSLCNIYFKGIDSAYTIQTVWAWKKIFEFCNVHFRCSCSPADAL
jgi:hypothetical protein